MIDYNTRATKKVTIFRLFSKILINISKSHWIPSSLRIKLWRMGGVNIGQGCFVGESVRLDTIHPELIEIGDGCTITAGVCILTHFRKDFDYYIGSVKIGNRVFIGMNTIIANSVEIGNSAIVGAGSIVTKDIPAGEIWAGNPARFIRKREDVDNYISKKK